MGLQRGPDEVNFYREQSMLYVPCKFEYVVSENIDFRSIYGSKINLIQQNRSGFESSDQGSIDEAMNVLEDIDRDELNLDGVLLRR